MREYSYYAVFDGEQVEELTRAVSDEGERWGESLSDDGMWRKDSDDRARRYFWDFEHFQPIDEAEARTIARNWGADL